MYPADLQTASFAAYPPQARKLAEERLALLRRLPLPLLPILLREVSTFDWKFPREREDLLNQLHWLQGLSAAEFNTVVQLFRSLRLPSTLGEADWVNDPAGYMEILTSTLWATGQMPAFREAARYYGERVAGAVGTADQAQPPVSAEEGREPQAATGSDRSGPRVAPGKNVPARVVASGSRSPYQPRPRLVIVVLADSLAQPTPEDPPYRQLRREGVLLRGIDPSDGLEVLQSHVEARAASHDAPYGHWWIDGAEAPAALQHDTLVSTVGYDTLLPTRDRLLARARDAMNTRRSGPEELRTLLARLSPQAVGMPPAHDPVMAHFELSLLTEGSGTQIFSTTFVQWAARECLRRAQPSTLLVRYTPRQREQGMNELLSGAPSTGFDPAGSLVDADQGAWYTWLNLQRLPQPEMSRFLVWQQGSSNAVAIGPGLSRGSTSSSPLAMPQVLQLLA